MDLKGKTTGLNYEAEYNHLKEVMERQKAENTYLREELRYKEKELQYYYGFEAACKLILGEVSRSPSPTVEQ